MSSNDSFARFLSHTNHSSSKVSDRPLKSENSYLKDVITGLANLFNSTQEPPKLDDLEKESIRMFLDEYDSYGLRGGFTCVKQCIQEGLLRYICLHELTNSSVENVTDQALLGFLNKESDAKSKYSTIDEVLERLSEIKFNIYESDPIRSLFIEIEKGLSEMNLSTTPNEYDLCMPEEKQVAFLLCTLPGDLKYRVEKRIMFMNKPMNKISLRKVLEKECKDYTWIVQDAGSKTDVYNTSPLKPSVPRTKQAKAALCASTKKTVRLKGKSKLEIAREECKEAQRQRVEDRITNLS